jgi:hypothetical protein
MFIMESHRVRCLYASFSSNHLIRLALPRYTTKYVIFLLLVLSYAYQATSNLEAELVHIVGQVNDG